MSPFQLTLYGYLPEGETGEIWRFNCVREGLQLEVLDGVKVKAREPQPQLKKRQAASACNSQLEPVMEAEKGWDNPLE